MKISILVPAFNAEKFISSTILSVKNQNFTDWEMIIVDDGSTDKTVEIVNSYAADDKRIKLFTQTNRGGQIARNVAFSHSNGEYIVLLDADDQILPNKLYRQAKILDEKSDYGLVYGDTWHCNDQMKRVQLESLKYPGQHVSGDVYEKIINGNIFAVHSAMVRRKCILDVGLHDENPELIADWDLWIRVAEKYKFFYEPIPVAEYRFHNAMSAKNDSAKKQFYQRMGVARKIQMSSRYKELKSAEKSFFHFCNARFAHKFGLYEQARSHYVMSISELFYNIKSIVGYSIALLKIKL